MQTLWARAAQARGACRCPQCLSTVNGVSRRATATATRRMPRYLTSSTFWYSGIFAVAATYDAAAKQRRREQWDLAIADARQETEQAADHSIRLHDTEKLEYDQEATLPLRLLGEEDTSASLEQPRPAAIPSGRVEEHEECDAATVDFQTLSVEEVEPNIFRDVDPDSSRPHWPANTGSPLNVFHLPPQSIFAPAVSRDRWSKTTQVPKKNAAVQMAIEMLQLTLFLQLVRRDWSEEAANAVPEDFAKHILLDQMEQTRRLEVKKGAWHDLRLANGYLDTHRASGEDVRLCHFTQNGSCGAEKSLNELDRSLRALFDCHEDQELSRPALYAKIAYNLSNSPAVPNVRTFNTLLLGFSRLGDRAIVDPLIAYMRQANVRPNEVTLAVVLQHYTKTNQPNNFMNWVRMMRGKNGGLMLARADVGINATTEGRLIRHEMDPRKIVQLPYPTPYVFGSVIEGTIKFAGFDMALQICQNMGTDGWGLCMSGLTPLLNDCAARKDWTSGWTVWQHIQALKQSSRRQDGATVTTERIQVLTFAAVLMLCSKCGKSEEFDTVWEQALRSYPRLADNLGALAKHQARENEEAARREQENLDPSGELGYPHDNEESFVTVEDAQDRFLRWRRVSAFKPLAIGKEPDAPVRTQERVSRFIPLAPEKQEDSDIYPPARTRDILPNLASSSFEEEEDFSVYSPMAVA